LMTAAGSAGVPLLRAIKCAEHKWGRTPLLEAAYGICERLNGKPGDGALEVYAQLSGDLAAIEGFLQEWQQTSNGAEQSVILAMRHMCHKLCLLQQAVDRAPVSFHLQNENNLRKQFGENR